MCLLICSATCTAITSLKGQLNKLKVTNSNRYSHGICILFLTVVSKPTIISPSVNATVTRPGLPITLSCEVDGDPNHYWVGWFHRNSMIQTDDDDHSVSVSPSVWSLQGTTHHLTVHSVKVAGKYHCRVFTIQDGNVTDQVTHQVSIGSGT